MQVVYVHEAIYLLIIKIWLTKYEFLNEVVREICVIWFHYISTQPSVRQRKYKRKRTVGRGMQWSQRESVDVMTNE